MFPQLNNIECVQINRGICGVYGYLDNILHYYNIIISKEGIYTSLTNDLDYTNNHRITTAGTPASMCKILLGLGEDQ